MNRYTQLSSSTFNPLSYEEMSVLPAMRNKQHMTMVSQLDTLKNLPNTQLDVLPGQPTEYVQAITKELDSMIGNVADELNTKGYSNAIMGDVLKLNNKYQQLLGANGDLGKLNAQKKAFLKDREEFLKNAEKAKFSNQEALNYWNTHQANFTGFDKDGNIAQHNPLSVPERLDVMDFAKDIKGMVGQVKEVLSKVGGGTYGLDEDGRLIIKNRSGHVHRVSNIPGLKHIEQLFNETFLTPGGKGFISNEFRNIDPLRTKIEFTRLLNAMAVNEVTDTRSESINVNETEESKAKAQAKLTQSEAMQPSVLAAGTNVKASERYQSYDDMMNKYTTLQNRAKEAAAGGKPLTIDESAELRDLDQMVNNYNQLLKDAGLSKEVENLNNISKKYSNELGFDVTNVTIKQKDQSKFGPVYNASGDYYDYYIGDKKLTKEQAKKYEKYNKETRSIKNKQEKLAKDLFKSSVVTNNEYSFNETGYDTKQDKITRQAKTNVITDLLQRNGDKEIVALRPTDMKYEKFNMSADEEADLRAKLTMIDPSLVDFTATTNSKGQTVYNLIVKPNAFKESPALSRFLGSNPELNNGFKIEMATSKTANTLGLGTAHDAMLNAPQDPLSRQLTTEMRTGNAAYRFGTSTGQALTADVASNMANGTYGADNVQQMMGGATSQDIISIANEAQQAMSNRFFNELANSTLANGKNMLKVYFELSPEDQEKLKEAYISSNASSTLIGY